MPHNSSTIIMAKLFSKRRKETSDSSPARQGKSSKSQRTQLSEKSTSRDRSNRFLCTSIVSDLLFTCSLMSDIFHPISSHTLPNYTLLLLAILAIHWLLQWSLVTKLTGLIDLAVTVRNIGSTSLTCVNDGSTSFISPDGHSWTFYLYPFPTLYLSAKH